MAGGTRNGRAQATNFNPTHDRRQQSSAAGTEDIINSTSGGAVLCLAGQSNQVGTALSSSNFQCSPRRPSHSRHAHNVTISTVSREVCFAAPRSQSSRSCSQSCQSRACSCRRWCPAAGTHQGLAAGCARSNTAIGKKDGCPRDYQRKVNEEGRMWDRVNNRPLGPELRDLLRPLPYSHEEFHVDSCTHDLVND